MDVAILAASLALRRTHRRLPVISIMASPAQLTEDEKQKALDSAGADLAFLLAKEGVTEEVQVKLYAAGVTRLSQFAAFATDVTDFKAVLKTDLSLDPADGLAIRVQVAGLVCAFKAAQVRSARYAEYEGELDAKQMTKPLPPSDMMAMRRAYEAQYWRLEDVEVPSRSYMEQRLEEIERGDVRAEPLANVFSKDEEQPDVLTPVWTGAGNLTLKRGQNRGEPPAGPEALRKRLTLMGVGLAMMGFRHTNRPELQGIDPHLMNQYLSYLLGDYCYNLIARTSDGSAVAAPAWSQVITYELAIRKKAWALVQSEGITFSTGLRQAWADPVVKERNFTTPLALHTYAKRAAGNIDDDGKGKKWRAKGDKDTKGGKGSGKGPKGDKGDGKGNDRTPDGRPICYRYNDKTNPCKRRTCKFVHVCRICLGQHPAFNCKGAASGADRAPPQSGQGETQASAGNHQ